jgi:acyl carrier protein
VHKYRTGDNNRNIGRPIPNKTIYILDEEMRPVPIGATGELYIGGVGLARGYLNKPELTAEKFVANPFQPNGLIYKTGDLVRYLPDGDIEYLGRNDFQVKIRGFRIELGEIESVIAGYAGVQQIAVEAKERYGVKYLAAYYVGEIDEGDLRKYLEAKLPEHMVPGAYMKLEKLPLTTNGKLDRRVLPEPETIGVEEAYEAPANEKEEKVINVFAEVLGLEAERLSATGDFFRLGGDSITAMQLSSRLRQHLGLQVPVKEIFVHRTARAIAAAAVQYSARERAYLYT